MKKYFLLKIILFAAIANAQCISGDCENGFGAYLYEDKTKIEANWKLGKPNGQSSIFFASGATYIGEMKDGKKSGKGKSVSKNNTVKEGVFENDLLNGFGKISFLDGQVYEGIFKNDTLSGIGKIRYKSGDSYEGQILNFDESGKGIYKYFNGDLFEGNFKEGKLHGEGILKFAKGGLLKGTWNNGDYISGPNKNNSEYAVKLIPTNGSVFEVNVEFNSVLKLDMILDTGAAEVYLTKDIVLTLIKAKTINENDILEGGYFMDASGNVNKSVRFNMREIKIGNKIIENVSCGVNEKVDGVNLLGLSFLKKLKSIRLNFEKNEMELK